jgi:hypothetical protein
MTRKLLLLLTAAFLLVPLGTVVADESAPAQKLRILVNSNTRDPSFHNLSQGYRLMSKIIGKKGHHIEGASMFGITDEDLEGFDILVLPIPAFSLLDEDKAAIRRFIRSGGGVLILAWSPSHADLSNLDSFIADYGIRFGKSSNGMLISGVPDGSPLSGPNACKRIYSQSGRAFLQVDGSKATIAAQTEKGEIFAAVSRGKNLGKGQLLVVGDDMVFGNNNVVRNDNEAFLLNTLEFLQGGYDLSVTLSKAVKAGDVSPGDRIKVVAKIKNLSSSASDAVTVRFILVGSSNATTTAAFETTLKDVKLSSLAPGKARRVSARIKVPASVGSGAYLLLTVVDPEGEGRDLNPGNNSKTGSKLINVN